MERSFIDGMCAVLSDALQIDYKGHLVSGVSGGCINRAGHLSDGTVDYFFKMNRESAFDMFAAEASGLEAMAKLGHVVVPKPICSGVSDGRAFLVMEWLELGHRGSSAEMGRALAAFHHGGVGASFGFERDNFIGATPQQNTRETDWASFFVKWRLDALVARAEVAGGGFPRYPRLRELALEVLNAHVCEPVLVHGDLWSGNAGFLKDGRPCIFDPAPYYGDREVDLAMSELFGGFPADFYQAYEAQWPTAVGREWRRLLYNLYHIINHFILFGGGYLSQANQMIEQLLQSADKSWV